MNADELNRYGDSVADVLGQVVEIGPSARESDLADAVARHVSARGRAAPARAALDVRVVVDFAALVQHCGEVAAWRILDRLENRSKP